MKKYKFGFVILHYNTLDDTYDCVNSIFDKLDTSNFEIVIVDNASPNYSGKKILEKYKNNEKVHVLLNKENLGFSKGNNVGIKYAIEKLNCDFIIMTNSDTNIIQGDFSKQIIDEYEYSNCALIGPEISNPDGNFQFPVYNIDSIRTLRKRLLSYRIHYLLTMFYLDDLYKSFLNMVRQPKINNFKNVRTENVILHGSCLIFTPKYFENFSQIPEKTKFYCEEEFIYLQIKSKALNIIYNPKIKILHKINGATKKSYKTNKKIKLFKYKNYIYSNSILLKEIKKIGK